MMGIDDIFSGNCLLYYDIAIGEISVGDEYLTLKPADFLGEI